MAPPAAPPSALWGRRVQQLSSVKEILMKKLAGFGVCLFLLCGVSGCGSSGPDATMKESIVVMNDLSSILEGIKDNATADQAIPKIEKQADRMKELRKKMQELKLSTEEEKKLEEKYKPETDKARERMQKAMKQALTNAPTKAMTISQTFIKALSGR